MYYVHWADNNIHDVGEVALYKEKVTVWLNLTSPFILSPYGFEEITVAGLQKFTVMSVFYQ